MSAQERAKILKAYEDLRVADVRDGMDSHMMHHYGSMDQTIRPLFRTRIHGIARTVRYLPFVGPLPHLTPDSYLKWSGQYYGEVNPYPWMEYFEPGDIMVIDYSGIDGGLLGSANSLDAIRRGVKGFVTNGGVRDTDELILQKCPFWLKSISQKMVQGRSMYDGRNIPVAVGGVTVRPHDMVVADGDGVIVVPREMALSVAKWAHEEHNRDKIVRKKNYEKLGLPLDQTVM